MLKLFKNGRTSDAPLLTDPKGPLDPRQPLPAPKYDAASDTVDAICFHEASSATQWYPAPMIGAPMLARRIVHDSNRYVARACDLLRQLMPDDYSRYMVKFYEEGMRRFGEHWGYADLVTIVLGLAEQLKPRRYLEIGVRRGRSVCAVAKTVPDCEIAMFDMWISNYAGMENPGPEFVKNELKTVGHGGPIEFVDGNSHETLPAYFAAHPGKTFDLITVDGDHTNLGAAQDICDVLPRLAVGGAIVFDDICHPKTPGLRAVWSRMVADDNRFSAWSCDDVGYGVGFAIRKW